MSKPTNTQASEEYGILKGKDYKWVLTGNLTLAREYFEGELEDKIKDRLIDQIISKLPPKTDNPFKTDSPAHHLTLGRNTMLDQVTQLLLEYKETQK